MTSGKEARPVVVRSVASCLAETVAICAAGLVLILWIIPSQTTGGGLGLSPGFLPTACAIAATALVAIDGAVRLARRAPQPRYPAGWSASARIAAVAILGTVALRFLGPAGCALVTIPACMLAIGEQRWILVVPVTAASVLVLFLATR